MYEEFNGKDGENINNTGRPSGGIYSGQNNESPVRPERPVSPVSPERTYESQISNASNAAEDTVREETSATGVEHSPYVASRETTANTEHSPYAAGRETTANTEHSPYAANRDNVYRTREAEVVKKEKTSTPFWRKIVGALALGLVFGLTAGITIYFVNVATGKIKVTEPDAIVEDKQTDTAKEEEKETVSEKAEATNTKISTADIVPEQTAVTSMDVSQVVEGVMPSVVSITGDFTVTSQDFFGQVYSQQSSGSGSGIIIGQDDDHLLIATNNHVVEDATALSVQFIDGTKAEARIKGTNSDIDLAVIMVDISDLSTATKNSISVAVLGDSDSLKVGETAIAIGNALGYGQSVTTGVISAVDRQLTMSDGTVAEGLIQTDAAINPGNSGGALVNASGEVIGINSSKIGGTTVDGVGFAIPISSAEPILDDIVTSEERVKVASGKTGYLGIGGVTVTEEASEMYGIPVGVVVRKVYAGTGAEKAGIQQGDVITSVSGKQIKSMEDLKEELQYYEAGETVDVVICRISDGSYINETVSLELTDEKSLND